MRAGKVYINVAIVRMLCDKTFEVLFLEHVKYPYLSTSYFTNEKNYQFGQGDILWCEVKGHMNDNKHDQKCRDMHRNVCILLESMCLLEIPINVYVLYIMAI